MSQRTQTLWLAVLIAAGVGARALPQDPRAPKARASEEYTNLLSRLKQGDMNIDFRALRRDGAILAGPRFDMLELADRATLKQAFAASDPQRALDSANGLLELDYGSTVAHFDAMKACRALGKSDEAAQHEKLLNALLDSIAASGDGKTERDAYFATTPQEEYIFLALRLKVRPHAQSLIVDSGHFYDRLQAIDPTTNQDEVFWFNADVQMNRNGGQDLRAASSAIAPITNAATTSNISSTTPTVHYTPPDDGNWAKLMDIDVNKTPESDKDHFVIHFTVPDSAARFVSPDSKSWQFNLVKIYGSRMQWGSRTDIPNGVLPWPTGSWKPGDRVTLDFDIPKEFTSAADGWSLRFCVGTQARCLPSPNLLLDAATSPATFHPAISWIDTFTGKIRGEAYGTPLISLPFGGGAVFSRPNDSRIEYRTLPHEGTLEWWVLIRDGYHYDNSILHEGDSCTVLFGSEVNGEDVAWPGATRLTLCSNGDITLDMTPKKSNGPHEILRATSSNFRFGEWHSVGISYGSFGQAIALDGIVLRMDTMHRQTLGAAGTHDAPVDVPTIGQTVSAIWPPHRYDSGFEGIVARFRVSGRQMDWDLTKAPPPAQLTQATNPKSATTEGQPSSLCDQDGIAVFSVETQENLELTVRAPDPVHVSVEVDRDQNGKVDRLVDVAYRPQPDGSLCTQYLIDETHSTTCGQFLSAAYVRDQKEEEGRLQLTLVLPKKELSFTHSSARLGFVMWNSAQRQTTYFPPERFQSMLTVPYQIAAVATVSPKSLPAVSPDSGTGQPANHDSGSVIAGFGLGSGGYSPDDGGTHGPVYTPGGNISNPVLRYAPDPHFSNEASRAHFQGIVVLGLIVDEKGNPQKVHIVRPLGMGLDEEALKAVRRYKFKPALKDGKTPVPVSINVEVNFRLLR